MVKKRGNSKGKSKRNSFNSFEMSKEKKKILKEKKEIKKQKERENLENKDKTNNTFSNIILSWYPGHMFKTKKQMQEALKSVNVAVEVKDARIPFASSNPDLDTMITQKTSVARIIVLNKVDLADPDVTSMWKEHYEKQGYEVILCDAISQKGISKIKESIRKHKKGITAVKTIILGIPNVGKSTIINKLVGRNSLEVKNKPGVTKSLRWVRVDDDIAVLDSPGMLWPRFEDKKVGVDLAITGGIKDELLDTLDLACNFLNICLLNEKYKEMLFAKYDISKEQEDGLPDSNIRSYRLLEIIGSNKKLIQKGSEVDVLRTSMQILKDYRDGKIGPISLERPQ